MTLLLGILAPWGAWMASDHRLTRLPGGQLITDTSLKHLGIKAPDGTAVLTYTGFGRVAGEDVSDWLRTSLRGENRTLEATAEFISARATARFGQLAFREGVLHAFVIAAYLGDQAFLVTIANTDTPMGVAAPTLRRDFVVRPVRVLGPITVFGGAGAHAVTLADRDLLNEACKKRPRKPDDFLGLLAAVNRRAARSRRPGWKTVSAGCVTAYLPPDGGTLESKLFGDDEENGEKVESPPFLLFGIDATEMTRAMPVWDSAARRFGGEWDHEGAARRSVEPRKRR